MADDVRIVIDADAHAVVVESGKASRAIRSLGDETQRVSRSGAAFAAAGKRQTQTLHELGTAARRSTLALGALAAAGLTHLIKTGMDFEQQMSRVKGTLEANAPTMDKLTKLAQKMGAETKFSATEAADAMYELASAGFKADEMAGAMKGTLSLAAASNVDLATAAEISANALRGFELQSSKSTHVADVMAKAVASSSLELTDLQLSMKYISGVAVDTGQSFETMTAALSIMANAGIKGEQGGTSLRGGLLRLVKPTKMVSEGLKMLGLSAEDLQGPNGLKPLSEIVGLMTAKSEKLDKATRNTAVTQIFGTEAFSGMSKILNAGAPALDKLTNAYVKSDGASKKMADTQIDNVAGAFEQLTGSIETVETSLFMHFQKPLKEVLLDATSEVNTKGKEVEEFFDRVLDMPEFKSADVAGKLQIILTELDRTGLPDKMHDLIIEGFTTALDAGIPIVAEGAKDLAIAGAKAFGKAFIDADPLSRVLMAGYLLHKTGALAAFRAYGKTAGTQVAAGAATGAAAGAVSGGWKTTAMSMGKSFGITAGAAAAIAYGPEFAKYIKTQSSGKTEDFNLPKHSALAPLGIDLTFGHGDELQDLTTGKKALRDFGDVADATFKKLAAAKDSRGLAELADQARRLAREFPDAAGALEHFADVADRTAGSAQDQFELMRKAAGKNLQGISQVVQDTSFEINQRFGYGTQKATDALARNFEEAAGAIRKSMKAGKISVQDGMREIEELVTASLRSYGLSPSAAKAEFKRREYEIKSGQSTGGRARGGLIQVGTPGASARDNVPAMLNGQPALVADGEQVAVFNRHQQAEMDARLADEGGLSGFFASNRRPHYLAAGGVLPKVGSSAIPRVMVRDDLGAVSKIAQGAVDMSRAAALTRLGALAPAGGGVAGGPVGGGVSGNVAGAMALARSMGLAITSTTSGHHVANSWHYKGRAADVAGSPAQMAAFFNAASERYGSHLLELFYDPLGAIKNGQRIGAIGGHSDHVHIALAKGGIVRAAGGWVTGRTGAPPVPKPKMTWGAHRPMPKSKHPSKAGPAKPYKPGRYKQRLREIAELKAFEDLGGKLTAQEQSYVNLERIHGLTDEEALIENEAGDQVRNEPDIEHRAMEIDQLIALKQQAAQWMAEQQRQAAVALQKLQAGMRERTARIAEIKAKAKANIARIRALSHRVAEMDRAEDRLKGRKHHDLHMANLPERRRIARALDGLRDDNERLVGSRSVDVELDSGNAGGLLGDTRQQLGWWQDERDKLTPDVQAIPQAMFDADMTIQELQKEREQWTGTKAPKVDVPKPDDYGVADMLRQQLEQERAKTYMLASQFGVFKDFAPLLSGRMLGSFARGLANVPETGLAILHKDETVLPDPQGPFGSQLAGAAPAPVSISLTFADNSGQLVRLVDARINGTAAKVVSEQLGRRSRLIASAPGGR